jgi:peptidyl-dipeptidase Dcp
LTPFFRENISQIQKDAYHPDVNVHEVRRNKKDREEGGDELVAIFLHDNYARPHKSSGAWMSDYRSPKKNLVT